MWLRKSAWLAFCLLALTGCKEPKLPSPFVASDMSRQYAQADFQLRDASGVVHSLEKYREKVVVLFFGYTHCPDVCPTTLADLAQVMRLLDKEAGRVQVLFVSLDPGRDTPQMLGEYAPAFHPSFIGLTGAAEEIRQIATAFGVAWKKNVGNGGGYTLDHTAGTYLIEPVQRRVLLAPYGQRPELLAQDIRLLLALKQ